MTLSGTQFLQWPPQGATSGVPLLSTTTTTSAPLRAHPTRRPRACLSAAWALEQTQPRSRRRVRQPHSWHLASGYGTLIEGEEVKIFEKYQDFRRKEGGYKTLVEEKESPEFDKTNSASEDTVIGDKGLRTKENLRLFELKYQQNQQKSNKKEVVGGNVCELNSALVSGETETEPASAAAATDREPASADTVADSAALLEPRARRLNTGNTLPQPHGPRQHHLNTSSSTANFITSMPGIKNLITRRRDSPLKRRDSCSLARLDAASTEHIPTTLPSSSRTGVKKCETVLALTGLEGVLRATIGPSRSGTSLFPFTAPVPLAPVNRLRTSGGVTTATCSRCSSLLSLQAATGSRYSLNSAGFISVCGSTDNLPPPVLCKLCLAEVPAKETFPIQQCNCSFCKVCMKAYVEFEIAEGAYDISCPDAQCPSQGVLQMAELEKLVSSSQLEKHKKYRLNREVDLDKTLTWCPRAGCETVCNVCPTGERCSPQPVHCPTCISDFCSNCKKPWHTGFTCEENSKRLAKEGKNEDAGIPFDSDLIKCCPMCNVPIEKDEGCAQMMCKRCKHVFCWYCLASLDDDFLLRHYDKGPCKNKLGHSRASVIWHRTQVIGIFAGFGILLLVASPLLLLAAPCIVCCKCRVCNAGTKLENEEEFAEESAT